MGLGQVENYRSISVSEHEETIGDDPVMLFAKKTTMPVSSMLTLYSA